MKRNNVKNNLDEMQEQKLLKIEHNGCWFAFWGLLIAILVQTVLYAGPEQMQYMLGEWIVFMCLCVYLGTACLKNGIWDRRLKADPATNLLFSLGGGVVMAVVMFMTVYKRSGMIGGSVCVGLFSGGFVFVLCFIALTIGAGIYKKRVNEMEAEEE